MQWEGKVHLFSHVVSLVVYFFRLGVKTGQIFLYRPSDPNLAGKVYIGEKIGYPILSEFKLESIK